MYGVLLPCHAFQLTQPEKKPAEEDIRKDVFMLCRNCRHKITTHEQRIEVNGKHQHIFANPSGMVFQIGCFSAADGCANHGISTFEFTWFTGFGWRFSICGKCGIHLGWCYSKGSQGFYGLIMPNLIEEK